MRRSVRDAIVGFTVIGGIIGFASTALWLRGVRLGSSHWTLTARFDDAALPQDDILTASRQCTTDDRPLFESPAVPSSRRVGHGVFRM